MAFFIMSEPNSVSITLWHRYFLHHDSLYTYVEKAAQTLILWTYISNGLLILVVCSCHIWFLEYIERLPHVLVCSVQSLQASSNEVFPCIAQMRMVPSPHSTYKKLVESLNIYDNRHKPHWKSIIDRPLGLSQCMPWLWTQEDLLVIFRLQPQCQ